MPFFIYIFRFLNISNLSSQLFLSTYFTKKKGDFFGLIFSMYCIQHCFICRPSDSTVSEDAGIEPRTVATSALAVRRSNHWARSHPLYILLKYMYSSLYLEPFCVPIPLSPYICGSPPSASVNIIIASDTFTAQA